MGTSRIFAKDTAMTEKSSQRAANAQFAKMQRASDAKQATTEYESAAVALRAKTARLKALRLARDAAAPPPPPAAPKRKSRKKAKGSLSDWLDGQSNEGRNS
jgi:hypothetical protein